MEKNQITTIEYDGGSLRRWGCFVAGGLADFVKTDEIMNSTKYQVISVQNWLLLPEG